MTLKVLKAISNDDPELEMDLRRSGCLFPNAIPISLEFLFVPSKITRSV